MRLLGLDLGSSFLKAAVLDLETGEIGSLVRRPFPDPLPNRPAGWLEYDPTAIAGFCRELLEEAARTAGAVSGVLLTGQMAGVVLVDAQGNFVSPYYSWRDQRTVLTREPDGRSFHDARAADLSSQTFAEIGQELKPGSTLLLLSWLRAHNQLPSGEWFPVDLGDAIIANLCGAAPRFEITQAVGGYNLQLGSWHEELLRAWNIADLPRASLTPVESPAGEITLGSRRVPVYPCVGDHQCALFGAELQPGELSLNVSTGSQVSQLTTTVTLGPYQTRPYFGGQFLNTLTHLPAGRALAVWIKLLTELANEAGLTIPDPWGAAQRAAEVAPDTDLATQLTFFSGPLGEMGNLTHIREETLNVGTLFRASYRNMADNYAQCGERLCPQKNWTQLVFSGGLLQHNPLLQRFILERMPAPHRVCTQAEDTLWGLLMLARKISSTA